MATTTPHQRLDPAPRQYAPGVALVRRSARGAAAAPASCTIADIENWLLREAARESEMVLLLESFAWRMVAAGLPLDRAGLHVGTLHPQLIGFSWSWLINDALCDEVKISAATNSSESYIKSPIYRVIEHGETVRRRPRDPSSQAEFSIMKEIADQGIIEYVAMPLSGAGAYPNCMTIATRHEAGFTEEDFATICRLLDLFALHVGRHIAVRIADNALNAYLGRIAAAKVLAGTIQRGSGERIRAIIWASDLRGFTDLSARLDDANMIALLNAYFECLAGAVLKHGGEVLKFMGDGLLAVFPIEGESGGKRAADAAVAAAQEALAGLAAMNETAPPPLDSFDSWKPLRTGIALHEGDVFFGNIGAPERLDFTVIGSAVNEASRVEALQKALGRDLLITAAAARYLEMKLDDLGMHTLRGVEMPVRIFSPATS